jgi:signal transduction histidine kinase
MVTIKSDTDCAYPFRFLHDRIQQAAYNLIDENIRSSAHLEIGRLMTPSKEPVKDNLLFDLVSQLNMGRELIKYPDEILRLVDLNIRAGKKAIESTAYPSAVKYFRIALELLPGNCWQSHPDLTFKAFFHLSKAESLAGNFEIADQLFELLTDKATNDQMIDVYFIQLEQYQVQARFVKALEVEIKGLASLGVTIPETENEAQNALDSELKLVPVHLNGRKIPDLIDAPRMTSILHHNIMKLLAGMWTTAYLLSRMNLVAWCTVKMTTISLRHGNNEISAFGYVNYAFYEGSVLGNYSRGFEYGKLGVALSGEFKNPMIQGRTIYMFACVVSPWKENLKVTRTYYRQAYEFALEAGDQAYAGYAGFFLIGDQIMAGYNLDKVYQEAVALIPFYKRTNVAVLESIFIPSNLVTLSVLMGFSLDTLGVEPFVESVFLKKYAGNTLFLCWYYYTKIRNLYWFGDYRSGVAMLDKVSLIEQSLPGHVKTAEIYFYMGLHLLSKTNDADKQVNTKALITARNYTEKMKVWAASCPDNFLHKQLLLEAEIAKAENKPFEAMKLYKDAIASTEKSGYIQNRALANELAGRFYMAHGFNQFSARFFWEAHYFYKMWGAIRKCEDIEKNYPELDLARRKKIDIFDSNNKISTTSGISEELDLDSILRASQAISGDIVLADLFKSMMNIILENSGAEIGFLITQENEKLLIRAKGSVSDKQIQVLDNQQLKDHPIVSSAIVRFVIRSRNDVLLNDALAEGMFIKDLKERVPAPLSILCTPILYQGKVKAVLFLENNLTTGAFTPGRLKILKMLSAQMAISLENAQMYANLEQTIAERTVELNAKNKQIVMLEKEATEKQLAGGFAHEIRNALVGSKLVIEKALGYDRQPPHVSLVLENSRRLKEAFFLLKERLAENDLEKILAVMKQIFLNEEQLGEIMEVIYKSVNRGLSITQQIMDYARLSHETIDKQAVNIDQLILKFLNENHSSISAKGIEVRHSLNAGHIQIYGREDHFISIFSNLIFNARDALLDDSLTNNHKRKIVITSTQNDKDYQLRIEDNGVGIPSENLTRIFDAFFSTKPETGTGLGLGVVKKLISLYTGDIKVESEVGKGTIVTVRFIQLIDQ